MLYINELRGSLLHKLPLFLRPSSHMLNVPSHLSCADGITTLSCRWQSSRSTPAIFTMRTFKPEDGKCHSKHKREL